MLMTSVTRSLEKLREEVEDHPDEPGPEDDPRGFTETAEIQAELQITLETSQLELKRHGIIEDGNSKVSLLYARY
jgi:hypothetical protein